MVLVPQTYSSDPAGDGPSPGQRVCGQHVIALAAGEAAVVDARGLATLTVITGAGATASISRVDSATASAQLTGANAESDLAASSKVVLAVDWPFYRISSAGGPARVALA